MKTDDRAKHLMLLEQRALAHIRAGEKDKAAPLFEQLVREQPDWEHGEGFCSLAGCYEDMGRIEEARIAYSEALKQEPLNPCYLGNYASFLYLHGNPEEAYEAHLHLIRAASDKKTMVKELLPVMSELAGKLGISEESMVHQIANESSS
jgi:Flp pilus assembly protein TadD